MASHYFDAEPTVGTDTQVVDVSLPDVAYTMVTDRGVFSHGHLDIGTAVLLRNAPAPPVEGVFLDLGCGAGAIALALAKRSAAATVWAVDVNDRAQRALTAANADRNGVTNILVSSPDDVPAETRFDLIWTNPPIRIGKPALHTLLRYWLERLAPGGQAVLVVQKHLGADSLQRWLVGLGHPTDRIASHAGYRLLLVGGRAT